MQQAAYKSHRYALKCFDVHMDDSFLIHVGSALDQLSVYMSNLYEVCPRKSLLLQSYKHISVAQRHHQTEEGNCLLLGQSVCRGEGIYLGALSSGVDGKVVMMSSTYSLSKPTLLL